MKKLLGPLMAITLISSVSSMAVACARGPKMHQVVTKFNETAINGVEYSQSELFTAFNGTNSTFYTNTAPLKVLSRDILNLLGFNQNLVTQPKDIAKLREFYIGMDPINSNEKATPSVDGVFYGHGGNAIGMNQGQFYNQYNQTYINSISGLYDLYEYDRLNPGVVNAPGALASLNVIKESFANSPATQEFIDSFLDLNDKNYDSSWLSQKFNFGEGTDLSSFKLDSLVTPFEQTTTTKDGKTTEKLIFYGEKNLGVPINFPELNTALERTPDAKIGDNKSEPFNLLLLPPKNSEDIKNSSAHATFNLEWEYDKEAVDATKVWDMRKSADGWMFNATDKQLINEDSSKIEIGYVKYNESIVVPLRPLQIQYEYSTNARDASAPKYLVNLTIEGANAIFSPIRVKTSFKDPEDSKKLGNRFIKWQFTHYQFNDTNNVWLGGDFWKSESKKPGKGNYSGIRITHMAIQNAS